MKKKIAFFITISFLQLYFVLLIFNSSLPTTAIDLPFSVKKLFSATIKEGWAFFTRDPRESIVSVYVEANGSYKPFILPNGDISNFFGISRQSREYGFEVSQLHEFVKDNSWKRFHNLDSTRLYSNTVSIKRPPLIKYLPNSFTIVKVNRIPWAWANYPDKVTQNYDSVKVNLY